MNDLKINELEQTIKHIFQIGKIVGINGKTCRARVSFPDNGDIVSYEMPIIQHHTEKDKFYSMPSLDEYVLCAFLPNGVETGFILGSYYSQPSPPPVTDESLFNIAFEDGSSFQYDKKNHQLTADIKGNASITTSKDITLKTDANINITSKDFTIKADDKTISLTCKSALVQADEVTIKSNNINLGENGQGVVTGECICPFTGSPHADVSRKVKAVK